MLEPVVCDEASQGVGLGCSAVYPSLVLALVLSSRGLVRVTLLVFA